MESLWVAKTGLDAQQTRMSVVSNNLANINTVGFKKARAIFEDLLYQNMGQVGGSTSQDTQDPSGFNVGTGVRVAGTDRNFAQGSYVGTDNPLDVMIDGRGFFQVLLPDGGLAYSRDGGFKIDADGRLVTATGYELQPAVTIPDGVESLTISADGIIEAKLTGQAGPVTLGTMQIADFVNPAGLQPRGQNLYVETVASGTPNLGTPGLEGLGAIAQGALEGSNVNVVEELVNMIETQRAYEMNSKAISVSDQMLEYLNNNL